MPTDNHRLPPNPQPDGASDAELMRRLQGSDDFALNLLMDRWKNRLIAFTYRYVGNESDALDLAQETFVHVFEKRDYYREKGAFSSWLFGIAANLCRNFLRWKSRHPAVNASALGGGGGRTRGDGADDPPGGLESFESGEDTPLDAATNHERADAVRREIHALPHDLKTVILLFEYDDLSYEEIAAVLSCSKKAVETRLYRARAILRKSLASLLD